MSGLHGGNRLLLLEDGAHYFPALEEAIDAARGEVHLQSYIFENDAAGQRIGAALSRAAARGVAVHLLLDGYGSRELPGEVITALRGAGVQLLFYRPEVPFAWRQSRLRRMHRKLAVVDGRIAFVGGINIIDDLNTPHQVPPRYDYAVRVEGPVLPDILAAARRLWSVVSWTQLRRRALAPVGRDPRSEPAGRQRAAFLVRDNLRHRRDIEDAYLSAIGSARREIILACAYFLPGTRFRRALMDAAARGVTVRILLQGRVEYRLLHHASRALYGSLLAAGVDIHEYVKSFMHAKVAVIDGYWATVGSSNIDPFSMLLAREANLVVEDRDFAASLRDSLLARMDAGARPVSASNWLEKARLGRALAWISYGLVRLLSGLAGVGLDEPMPRRFKR